MSCLSQGRERGPGVGTGLGAHLLVVEVGVVVGVRGRVGQGAALLQSASKRVVGGGGQLVGGEAGVRARLQLQSRAQLLHQKQSHPTEAQLHRQVQRRSAALTVLQQGQINYH